MSMGVPGQNWLDFRAASATSTALAHAAAAFGTMSICAPAITASAAANTVAAVPRLLVTHLGSRIRQFSPQCLESRVTGVAARDQHGQRHSLQRRHGDHDTGVVVAEVC